MQLSNSIRIISILLFLLFYGAKGDCYAKEKYLEIKKEKDLHGGVWKLPKGITLLFNGGIIFITVNFFSGSNNISSSL